MEPDSRPSPERVLVAIAPGPGQERLLRRASAVDASFRAVHVTSSETMAPDEALDRYRELAESMGGTWHEVVGSDVATALLRFARVERATTLVVGSGSRRRTSTTAALLRDAGPLDVHVVQRDGDQASRALPRVRRVRVLPWRRVSAGWALTAIGCPLLTLALAHLDGHVSLTSVLLLYLVLVVVVGTVGGVWPALAAAVAGSLAANWFFTPPYHTVTIAAPEHLLALVVFLGVAVTVSVLVAQAARRGLEAARARAEAAVMARVGGSLATREDPLPELLSQVRSAFGLESVALFGREQDEWFEQARAGPSPSEDARNAGTRVPIADDATLVLTGRRPAADDLEVLKLFAAQVLVASRGRRLRAQADEAERLAAVDALRTALLAAVSHDLRTPLASIVASVTSLLQEDVEWTPEHRRELLSTIHESADRLNGLVGNLLDMSRLQTGALSLVMRETGVDEVVASALAGLRGRDCALEVDVPESLPDVSADPALLERAVANVVDNAITWSPSTMPVRIEAGEVEGRVRLRVADCGPGIPASERWRAFQPFQRLGDRSNGSGVGLGLAVAKGFLEAMGGELSLEDTPGGGLTVVMTLKAA